jgi:myo-inositol 2-dehydrogenase/D-chiro-inositol 1-dehydrogenase
VLARLTMASGLLADVEVSVAVGYGYDVRCEALGSRGSATAQAPASEVLCLDGTERRPLSSDFRQRFADAYRLELASWVDSVRRCRPAGPSAWDGHAAILLAEACIRALRTGAPVALAPPPRPALYAS